MKKNLLFLFLFFYISFLTAQNKKILYDFAEIPQTLLLNPAADIKAKFHIGIPLLSGISAEFVSSKFVLSDLFLNDGVAINNKISSLLNTLSSGDYMKINSQIEVLNAGFRFKEKNYISFGFYQEIDVIGYFPKDLITLAYNGNFNSLNRNFSLSQINYKIDVLGVLHAGLSRKINKKVTLGARFKIYSSILNTESTNNSGNLITVQGTDNIYQHQLSRLNVNFRTAGIVDANDELINDSSSYLSNLFLGENLGVGFDFGITYNINEQLKFTTSILDLGSINYSSNTKTFVASGNYSFEGVNFINPLTSSEGFFTELKEDFEKNINRRKHSEPYSSARPVKVNTSLNFGFGKKKNNICSFEATDKKDTYLNAVGLHLNAVFRPLSPQFELTGFYERSLFKNIRTKYTYTINEHSITNFGFGFSANFGKLNFYGLANNFIQFSDIAALDQASVQIGFNLIF